MKFRFLRALVMALVVGGSAPTVWAQQDITSRSHIGEGDAALAAALKRVEVAIEAARLKCGVPGVSVAVVREDAVVLARGFGVRSVGQGGAGGGGGSGGGGGGAGGGGVSGSGVTSHTVFAIGSTTKAFTALLAQMSAEEGQVSLEASPRRYVGEFRLQDAWADAHVRVRDLLCHRSGLKRTDLAWSTGALERHEVIQVLGRARPTAPLGRRFQYNNVGYSVVGEVLAQAHHTTWEQLLHDRIFLPLQMTESVLSLAQMSALPDYSLSYHIDTRTQAVTELAWSDTPNIAAASLIKSNATDMAKWLRCLLNQGRFEGGRLVSQRGYDEMISPHIKVSPNRDYALGWFLSKWRDHKVVHHDGAILGYHSQVAFMPERRLGFVVLANARSESLQSEIAEIVWSQLAAPLPPALAAESREIETPAHDTHEKEEAGEATERKVVNRAELNGSAIEDGEPHRTEHALWDELVGIYEQRGYGPARIVLRDKGTFITSEGNVYPLTSKGKDVFELDGLSKEFLLSVRRDDGGRIIGLYFKQPHGDVTYTRQLGFTTPFSGEELMAKVVEAAGGETALREHPTRVTTFKADFENEGVTAEGTFKTKAPTGALTDLSLMAAGKPIGTVHEYFQDSRGDIVTNWEHKPFPSTPVAVWNLFADSRIALDIRQLLEWRTLFKSISIVGLDRVGNADVFVVEKVPVQGTPITDYISTATFLVLRRDSPVTGWVRGHETYSDYREIDGVMVPHHIEVQSPTLGRVLIDVQRVRFDEDVPDSDFGPQPR